MSKTPHRFLSNMFSLAAAITSAAFDGTPHSGALLGSYMRERMEQKFFLKRNSKD